MAVRTQAEISAAITSMLANNTAGDITAADVRGLLNDINDTMFDLSAGGGGVTGQHLRYVGWSDDAVIDASDFAGAASSADNDLILPARVGNGYIWFAVPESIGYPVTLHIAGGSRNALPRYARMADTVDDPNGEPHLIGVSPPGQVAALAGQSFVLGY